MISELFDFRGPIKEHLPEKEEFCHSQELLVAGSSLSRGGAP